MNTKAVVSLVLFLLLLGASLHLSDTRAWFSGWCSALAAVEFGKLLVEALRPRS